MRGVLKPLLCEIQSWWEAGYLVNAHTAVVSVVQLARKKLQRILTVLKNRTALIFGLHFFDCCLDHCGLYSDL